MNFDNFFKWFATSPIASFLRVAIAIVAFQAMTDFVASGHFNFSNAEHWFIAALSAALPGLLRWINPEDNQLKFK